MSRPLLVDLFCGAGIITLKIHHTEVIQQILMRHARQDKAPLYLVSIQNGAAAIPLYDDEPEVMQRIKIFMAHYGLVDIKMRMLRVLELLKIQGFPAEYVLCGNQSDQKKFIGNSVVPQVVKAWIEAMAEKMIDKLKKAA